MIRLALLDKEFGPLAREYLEKLTAFVEEATSDCCEDVDLVCKHFFSGAALYAEKRICLSLTPVGLAMKLPAKTREELLGSEKAVPLRYFPRAPIKKDYVLFPQGVARAGRL